MQIIDSTADQTLHWLLQDPHHGNSLGPSFVAAVEPHLLALEADCARWRAAPHQEKLTHRLLVIAACPTGRSHPLWIAGGNLKELAQLKDQAAGRAYAAAMTSICLRLTLLPIPVVMAITGDAIGGGAEFALAGDLRLATRASHLDFKQLSLGLAMGYGSTSRLVSLVGLARATQILLLRSRLSAETALHYGLIDGVAADALALQSSLATLSSSLLSIDPIAVASQKEMLAHASAELPPIARARELDLFSALWMGPAHKRALQRFNES